MTRYDAFKLLFEPDNGWVDEETTHKEFMEFEAKLSRDRQSTRSSAEDFKVSMAVYRDTLPIP